MLKPASLRDHLTRALPDLARDPEKLMVLVPEGSIQSTLTDSLSYEYGYTLRLILLDFATHADAVMAPLLIWLRTHQSDLLDNPEKRAKAIRFSAEFLSTTTMDLVIDLDLTERVLARPRPEQPGALNLVHVPEPAHISLYTPAGRPPDANGTGEPGQDGLGREHWSFWLKNQLLAEWDYDPRPQVLRD